MVDKLKRKRWKIAFTLITFLALFGLAYGLREQIFETIRNLGRVNAMALLLIPLLQVANYHGQTRLYQSLFKILGTTIPYKHMYRVALELSFINTVFPSGGISGFSYISLRLRQRGISAGRATLVQMMRFIMLFISFQIVLFGGLLLLALEGKANSLMILVAGSLATLLVVLTLLIGFVIGSKTRINAFFTFVTQIINRIIHVVRRGHPETISIARVRRVFTDLHENFMHIKNDWRALRGPVRFSLLTNIVEVGAIYSVYIAFGEFVNPGAVIIAYAIANFAGLISVLPGGVGIYEALMTAVLAAAGVPPGVSLPVTVMYRVLNMATQVIPGYILYQRSLQQEAVGKK